MRQLGDLWNRGGASSLSGGGESARPGRGGGGDGDGGCCCCCGGGGGSGGVGGDGGCGGCGGSAGGKDDECVGDTRDGNTAGGRAGESGFGLSPTSRGSGASGGDARLRWPVRMLGSLCEVARPLSFLSSRASTLSSSVSLASRVARGAALGGAMCSEDGSRL